MRELQTTETEDRAIASEAHTGLSRIFPIGYKTPAAIGTAAMLYTNAHKKLNFTRRNTVVDRSTRVSTPLRFGETRMNEALESATSLPDPIAIETSAVAIAGASFMPSPTIATIQRLFNLFPNNLLSLDRCFFGAFS
jgi:hypothetical protein